jgi:hypothetical protein
MPEPLAMPVTLNSTPSSDALREVAFDTMSVVMIASAAAAQLSAFRSASAAGSAATILSCGSGSRITPVEKRQHLLGLDVEVFRHGGAGFPRAAQAVLAGAGVGVAGVDHQGADARTSACRCSLQTVTGAAQKRFWVNTPTTSESAGSVMTRTSRRPGFLMPALKRCPARRRQRKAGRRDRVRRD